MAIRVEKLRAQRFDVADLCGKLGEAPLGARGAEAAPSQGCVTPRGLQ